LENKTTNNLLVLTHLGNKQTNLSSMFENPVENKRHIKMSRGKLCRTVS
jgi:hypothetical protein